MEDINIYGYMRVSSKEQNEDRQKIALTEMGVPENNIYMDKQSGKDFERTQYKRLLRKLNENSVLYIKSIDRLEHLSVMSFWHCLAMLQKMNAPISSKDRRRELQQRKQGV